MNISPSWIVPFVVILTLAVLTFIDWRLGWIASGAGAAIAIARLIVIKRG